MSWSDIVTNGVKSTGGVMNDNWEVVTPMSVMVKKPEEVVEEVVEEKRRVEIIELSYNDIVGRFEDMVKKYPHYPERVRVYFASNEASKPKIFNAALNHIKKQHANHVVKTCIDSHGFCVYLN